MTPFLLLAILTTPTTPPTTIHTTTNQETHTMASIPYPERHPNQPTPGRGMPSGTTFQRIGMSANHPMSGGARPAHGNQLAATGRNLTPTEHTARPTPR